MAKEARHHHYIPQCYLRGFAVGSGKRRRVTVANLQSQQFFETKPRNVGGIKDFNRIGIPGFKPDALEGMLSSFESEAAVAIRNVSESKKFEGDNRNAVLNLIALLAVRSPQQRENFRQFEERVMKQVLGLSLATEERWESQMRQMKEAGYKIDENVTYQGMVEFYKEDEYDIKFNTEHHLALEFGVHDAVLHALAARRWMLYTTTEVEGYFVTSDRPVVLTWKHPEEMPPLMRDSPGFGMTDTEVVFPLTKDTLLLGSFEEEDGVRAASTEFVAVANVRMILYAFSQVYMVKRAFPYIGPGKQLYHDRNFMERFEVLRKENERREAQAGKESG